MDSVFSDYSSSIRRQSRKPGSGQVKGRPRDWSSVGSGFAYPKGPCNGMVDVWALKGFLYPYFLVCLCTIMILGPFGIGVVAKIIRNSN